MEAKLIQVIQTELRVVGSGTDRSPKRTLTQYWLPDGTLLAEVDPWAIEALKRLTGILAKVQQATQMIGGQPASISLLGDLTFMKQSVQELSDAVEVLSRIIGKC